MQQQESDALLFVLCLWLSGVIELAVDLLALLVNLLRGKE